MKKKKVTKTNALRTLDQQNINYEERAFDIEEYAHMSAVDVARQLGTPLELIYKTLVVVGNKTGPIVAVIPSNQTVDFKKLAKVSGNKKVELLHLKELESTTGYIRGGCSPIGMKKQFPTYIEEAADSLAYFYLSAGKRGLQMKVNPHDVQQLISATFASITE
ncbi:Cys-tRNA(Pro) deacylase [Vagococcus xieshaowenii]|uniref:Cys-tRNA(Pro)/Cys-tRNA(Cys) deacylase n=1 Tax=Vagococcus xieshaowenii TaxID=2562451 RepID=A0AAJ5EET8_9ENTE|nr:Cys-tRNA(Pro) deacylase [Vagococcus xieshaowenii]QCA28136.1 Cys-tRNA(Pro) deacylase [Vagococcus xieshaowenii]TFZ39737.1 Cys-tRNA(Pro) deacylase [Vagococcus xieshaowenii]